MLDSKSHIAQSLVVGSFCSWLGGPDLDVRTFEDSLFLTCADDETRGCHHVRYAFENNLDYRLFDYAIDTTSVEIPISTINGLWEYVSLSDAHPQFGHREVRWKNPHLQEVVLGVVRDGDGRRIVQDMLFEYYYADKLKREWCQNSLHGPAAQQAWNDTMNNGSGRSKIIAKWLVYSKGWCLWCCREHEKQMADPNLVPEGTGWNN